MIDKEKIVPVFKTIFDPDLYIDIWTLGLIYDYKIENSAINVKMTFTSPACPAAPQLIGEIKQRLGELEGVSEVNVEVVFQPPWEPSEELKALMGLG